MLTPMESRSATKMSSRKLRCAASTTSMSAWVRNTSISSSDETTLFPRSSLMLASQLRFLIAILCLSSSFSGAAELPAVKPEAVGLSSQRLAKVDEAMDQLIKDKKLAGGIVMIARHGKVAHQK